MTSNALVTRQKATSKPAKATGKVTTFGKDHADAEAIRLESVIGATRGYWWRASRYELRDGRIVPAGAVRQYDPAKQDPRPHESLFALAHSLRLTEGRLPPFNEIDPGPVLEWVTRFGLLGILPARLLQLRAAAVWRLHAGVLLPATQTQTRTPTGWKEQISFALTPAPDSAKEGEPVPQDLAPAAPEAIMLNWEARDYQVGTPAALGLNRFFGVATQDADGHQYPMPLSDSFWREYGEPLPLVLNAIAQLARAISGIGKKAPTAFDAVNWMLTGAQPFIQPARIADAATRDGLTMPTIIHTMAEAIRRDSLANVKPRNCPNCGSLFQASEPRRVYCGPRCQERFKQREYRRRLRDAKGK